MNRPGWEGRSVERYRLIRRIGRGGMGEVYLAELEPMPGVKKLAAVKLLKDVGLDPGAERGFAAEARLAALISHPHVVQLVDAGVSDEVPWLAMEFVAGLSLHELLLSARARQKRLPPWVVARIIADACAGLHAVHEAKNERGEPLEIVHRDVTPHNVLIGWDGVVKVTDFGVARSRLQSTVTRTGTVKGKLAYMAPEQASGNRVDRRADVFALGVLLWESASGKKLFKGANATETLARVLRCEVPELSAIAPEVPVELSAVARRALAPDPGSRFATAREMQRALEGALRAAGIDIGHAEIAEIVASLVPERVREHEAWLKEHDRRRLEQSESQVQSARSAVVTTPSDNTFETVETSARKRTRARFQIWVALALLAAGGTALIVWAARSPETSTASSPSSTSSAPAPIELEPDMPKQPAAPPEPVLPPAPSATAVASDPRKSAAPLAPAPAPAKAHGTLNVGSSPVWAAVFVDGRSVGATPIAGLRLTAGAHVVEARARGKAPVKRRSVKVPADGSASVHFQFDPE